MDIELLKNIDRSKIREVKFNFAEMSETEFEKFRKRGMTDEEICKIARDKKAA